ncbi:hypothetical protein RFM23_30620 [Mesorhizobium abyssinicae]|uniref:Antifreeze protein n=2 Tax=Mesorhizobium abyssinicae TaxID=1209958 RepID=A0ABU5AXA7_9HYPH|nr:hypothetical protein [Mesorhizobium abyssinicae]MDX8541959.1 hypothetical protein [Mesorhizobium abyssinicae]
MRPFSWAVWRFLMFNPWFDLCLSALEAQQVIWLRTLRIAGGGKFAEREAKRMVLEKVEAAGHAGMMLASGASAVKVAAVYRRKISANKKRLSS